MSTTASATATNAADKKADFLAYLCENRKWLHPDYHTLAGSSGHDGDHDGSSFSYQRIYQMLKENPNFAKELIKWGNENGGGPSSRRLYEEENQYREVYPGRPIALILPEATYPISYLLAASHHDAAPLEIIQEVYQMFPDAVALNDEEEIDSHPLQDAIVHRCSPGVISFLVKENPSAVFKITKNYGLTCNSSNFPIDLLIRRQHKGGFIDQRNSPFFIDGNDYDYDADDDNNNNYEDFVNKFKLLYNASPEHFWGSDTKSFSRLLRSPGIPPSLFEWLALRRPLDTTTPTNAPFCYSGELGRPNYVGLSNSIIDQLIKNLGHFLPTLKCKEMKVEDMNTFGYFILKFFASSPPTLVKLQCNANRTIFPPYFSTSWNHNFDEDIVKQYDIAKQWSSCQIQEIRLDYMQMGNNVGYNLLLRTLRFLPNLKKLSLRQRSALHCDCTDAIIDLLEAQKGGESSGKNKLDQLLIINGSSLPHYINRGLEIDVQTVLTAIHKWEPTTFVGYSTAESNNYNIEIAYHSSIYQNRPKITASNATAKHLIECLCNVAAKIVNSNDDEDENQNENNGLQQQDHSGGGGGGFIVESVWYGLLREVPGLWITGASASTAVKKRRQASSETLESSSLQNKKIKT